MLSAVLWLLPLSFNLCDGKAALGRQLIGRQSEASSVYMQGHVKHGDYLRTLGGAMTAQCKVLHLLFSQSDYPKIVECHIIQRVGARVGVYFIGVLSQRGFGGGYLKQENQHRVHVLCRVYKLIRGVPVLGMTLMTSYFVCSFFPPS